VADHNAFRPVTGQVGLSLSLTALGSEPPLISLGSRPILPSLLSKAAFSCESTRFTGESETSLHRAQDDVHPAAPAARGVAIHEAEVRRERKCLLASTRSKEAQGDVSLVSIAASAARGRGPGAPATRVAASLVEGATRAPLNVNGSSACRRFDTIYKIGRGLWCRRKRQEKMI
jgi:hypothetical protein